MDTLELPPVILIIEDTVAIAALIADLLELEFQAQIVVATHGSAAVAMLRSVRPALIILDYQLPGFSGIDIYDWLQAQPTHAAIPVLWMTANADDPAFRQRQFTPVLRKPFALDMLIHEVQRLLGGH